MKWTVECIRIKNNRLARGWGTFECATPDEAMKNFIETYLSPVELLDKYYGGINGEENKFISCRLAFKDTNNVVFLLSCRYKDIKRAKTEKLLDPVIKDSTVRVESVESGQEKVPS